MYFFGGANANQLRKSIIKNYNKNNWLPIVFHARENCKNPHSSVKTISDTIDVLSICDIPVSYAIKYSSFNDITLIDNLVSKMFCKKNTKFVFLDAETELEFDNENKTFDFLIRKYKTPRLFKTYQMYRIDSLKHLSDDIKKYKTFGVKLVRGAYYSKSNPILYKNINDTHKAYNTALMMLKNNPDINVLAATHNTESIEIAKKCGENVYFAQLLGMGDRLSSSLVKTNFPVMKYTPYGRLTESLPYLFRRIRENLDLIKLIVK